MTVTPHHPADPEPLAALVAKEPDARPRDRYRAVRLATEGLARPEIARRLGRPPRLADGWAGRYRRGGLAALGPRKRPGRRPKLTPAQDERLRARPAAGPPARGADAPLLPGR